MSKIATPAFSEAIDFMKKEWRGVMLLSLKTYLLILLFQILASIPVHMVMGPQPCIGCIPINPSDPLAFGEIPKSLIFMNIVTGILGFILTQWIVAPLHIAISRSVVLGEPFDRILCKHLTEDRTLRVAKLLWSVLIIMIPLYASIFPLSMLIVPLKTGSLSGSFGLLGAISLIFCAYMVFYFYIMLRIYYLVPAFATDRKFATLSETWDHSKGSAWSVFKVMMLGILVMFCAILIFVAVMMLLSLMMAALAQAAVAGKLVLQILVGFLIFVMALFMTAVLVLIIPQLVTAGIASVYKMTQSKTE